MTTPLDPPALEALARAATPGPWKWAWDENDPLSLRSETHGVLRMANGGALGADTDFIAAFSPSTALALLNLLNALMTDRERLDRRIGELETRPTQLVRHVIVDGENRALDFEQLGARFGERIAELRAIATGKVGT